MKILFLGKTEVVMQELLNIVKQRIGKSLKIDDLGLSSNHPLALLATLTDFKDVPCKFDNLGPLLRHVQYVYLVQCPERYMVELAFDSGLNITTDPNCELAIVSGNLQNWRCAFIDGCSESALQSYREFTNLIFMDMEQRGIGQLFSNFRKVSLKDTTFKLIEKK